MPVAAWVWVVPRVVMEVQVSLDRTVIPRRATRVVIAVRLAPRGLSVYPRLADQMDWPAVA